MVYDGSMVNSGMELWSVFRMLGNAVRIRLVGLAFDGGGAGVNVSDAAEALGIGEPAVSTYLRQLADCGLLRRSRAGLQVNYLEDKESDAARRGIADALREHLRSGGRTDSAAVLFKALGNATRVSALKVVAQKPADIETISKRIHVPHLTVLRQMRPLVGAKIVVRDKNGLLSMLPPSSPLRKKILALASNHLLQ